LLSGFRTHTECFLETGRHLDASCTAELGFEDEADMKRKMKNSQRRSGLPKISVRLHIALVSLTLIFASCSGRESAAVPSDQRQSEPPTEISHTQIYASPDGETHFREVVVPLTRIAAAPPAQPVAQSDLQPATTIRHAVFEPNWGAYDRDNNVFHTPSSRRFASVRRGVMWVKASDGQTRKFQAGDILEVLDVAPSKGHITWAGPEPVVALFSNFE